MDSIYELPESPELIIAPKDYLVLWADNEPEEGPLHLGFKLRKNGEVVSIYNKNLELIDRIQYSKLYKDITYQRIPDGSNNWQYSFYPTLAYKNLHVNNPPLFVSNPKDTAYIGITYLYKISIIDFEDDNITIEAEDLPGWLKLTDNGNGTASLIGKYDENISNSFDIRLKATDGTLEAASYQEFKLYTISVPEIIEIANNYISPRNISIYPIPSKGNLIIDIEGKIIGDIDITIQDIVGRKIYYKKYINPVNDRKYLIQLNNYIPGVYLVIVNSENINIQKKIILY